ncbi:MAG: GxxExxY protein [Candidatus Ordinivivax streblomastigis]|uniref:GxxExxY protein n=1 Tax=Candidatus Ordinivivax streblomastigis TaxID=2540710 RepID=A0A5M8P2U8_9BACT|nr:MAG: GxxExxY protein [Candidatus Ordinivivax streblomastigis]
MEYKNLTENVLSQLVIGSAIRVHKALGPGLLENIYKECLYYELTVNNGLYVEKEKIIPVIYNSVKLDCACRIDLLVENKLVVELKSVQMLHDVHLAQTITYLRLGNYKLGLLMNFNVARLTEGIRRVVNQL